MTEPAAGQPPPGPPPSPAQPGPWPPGQSPPPPGFQTASRRRRGAATSVAVFAAIVLLCLGGAATAAVLLDRSAGTGTSGPQAAVDGFMQALTRHRSPDEAATYLCPQSRDRDEIPTLVSNIAALQGSAVYATFRWTNPPIPTDTHETSTVVTVHVASQDQLPAEARLRLGLVDEHGWWVCSVRSAS